MIMIELFQGNKDFSLGIYSGLTTDVLLYLFGKLTKYFLNCNPINIWLKSKSFHIYDNQAKAEAQIYKDAKNSEKIFVFSTVDSSLIIRTSKFIELLKTKYDADIRLILIKHDSSYIEKREKEVNSSVTSGTVKSQTN